MELNGIIVADKPSGWTSHDVVNRMRRIAQTRKVGHLGTLDPLATGVLPLLLNRATRLAQFFTANEKTYEGVIRFGFATTTYDADGEPLGPDAAPVIAEPALLAAMARFRGELQQTPPPVSAKKIQGRPAYELARKNIAVDLPPVAVTVHELDLLHLDGCEAAVRVRCSAGTYLRSIAHELGIALGTGAHLKQLRRVASGPFAAAQARTLDALAALAEADRLAEALVPAAELLPEFPAELVDNLTATQIRNGRDFRVSPFRARTGARYVKAVDAAGELIAIGEACAPHLYHPVVVI